MTACNTKWSVKLQDHTFEVSDPRDGTGSVYLKMDDKVVAETTCEFRGESIAVFNAMCDTLEAVKKSLNL